MPNAGALTSFTATYVSDSYIRLDVNGATGNPNTVPERLYFSRWNQADNTWGGEYYVNASLAYSGNDPGSIAPVANRTYKWRVRGWRSDGSGDANGFGPYLYSGIVQTSPAAPTNVTLTQVGPGSMTVTWTNNATNAFYDYTTDVLVSINGADWAVASYEAMGVSSRNYPDLEPGVMYRFGVRTRAANDLLSPIVGSVALVSVNVPAAPSGAAAARVNDSQATVSWTNNSTPTAPYDTITIQRLDSASKQWKSIANVAGNLTGFTDAGLVTGNSYQWRVLASNAVGSSGYAETGIVVTTPVAPTNVSARYTGGTTITALWTDPTTYPEHSIRVQPYRNGVADGSVQSLARGVTQYEHTFIAGSSYYFRVYFVSDSPGSLQGPATQSNTVVPALVPSAPTNLTMSAPAVDKTRAHSIAWKHNPTDGSDQLKYQIRHRISGASTWTESSVVTSGSSTASNPWSGYSNGVSIEWQVRTYGVHASPSPYSASAIQQTSAVPTVTVTGPPANITTSSAVVTWAYLDAEGTAQSAWKVDLYESATGTLVASRTGDGTASSVTIDAVTVDGKTYRADVQVRDGQGVWSDKASRTFSAAFTPPAPVNLDADIDPSSGASVLTFTPTDSDGTTTLPASAVTVERRFYDPEAEAYGPWETVIEKVNPKTVLIDPTGPSHDDGQYRLIPHSLAPSIGRPTTPFKPPARDQRWLYVSGGSKFDLVCKMWANIEISQTAFRAKELHYFAGRRNPVIYTGTAAERTYSVSGILEDEASDPAKWVQLARAGGPVLLRAPGRRMYGSLSDMSIERIQNNMHSISFSIQEVSI